MADSGTSGPGYFYQDIKDMDDRLVNTGGMPFKSKGQRKL